jgi:hypothetical protein
MTSLSMCREWRARRSKLVELMLYTSDREATDSRDKVFALLQLATDADHPSLQANYDLSLEQVLTNVVKFYIKNKKSLDILSLVTNSSNRAPELSNAPSWIPDIITTRNRKSIALGMPDRFHASAGTGCDLRNMDSERVIVCGGVVIDTIAKCADCEGFMADLNSYKTAQDLGPNLDLMWRYRLAAFLEECDQLAAEQVVPYPTNEDAVEVFWRTIIFDTNEAGERLPAADGDIFYRAWREKLLLSVVVPLSGISRSWGDRPIENTRQFPRLIGLCGFAADSTLCVTKRGYLGCPPNSAQPGDLICILFGGDAPFVIRPCEGTDEFILIGETYLHGFMQGEALKMEGLTTREIRLR